MTWKFPFRPQKASTKEIQKEEEKVGHRNRAKTEFSTGVTFGDLNVLFFWLIFFCFINSYSLNPILVYSVVKVDGAPLPKGGDLKGGHDKLAISFPGGTSGYMFYLRKETQHTILSTCWIG